MKKKISLEMNDLPIRYKIIALLLIISILPSIGLGSLISMAVDHTIDKQINNHTLQLIGQANKSLEAYVETMQDISYLVSFNPEIIHYLKDRNMSQEYDATYDMQQFLRGLTTVNPEIAGILVINSEGKYISNEMYTREIHPLIKENWYRTAVQNNGIFKMIGHPSNRSIKTHVNYKNNEIVSGVRAILDPETQNVIGVILIDLKLRVISETLEGVTLGKSGYLIVMDEEGQVVYSPEDSLVNKIKPTWFGTGTTSSLTKNIDDKEVQFIYRKDPFSNWTTIGVFATNDSAMEIQQINFYVISFLFIVCAFGLGSSYYFSYSMSRPINQLNAFMNSVESGDLTIRYRGERADEIGRLGRSFNQMLNHINRLIALIETQGRQKREAELKLLQSHIKPHFLYNTLDTINWMARKKGAEEVAEVVDSLSQLFRIGLNHGRDTITLEKEVEHIESYLKIQKARYKEKIRYCLKIEPNGSKLLVNKLILQPLVENAIYHGIKERRGPGIITISASIHQGLLLLSVEDDGIGMEPERLAEINQNLSINFNSLEEMQAFSTVGYGVMNVQARIKLAYGDPFGLSVESVKGKGTIVKILLPLIHNFTSNAIK